MLLKPWCTPSDPVESLSLCCVSSDPQMLLSTHDSSQIILLSFLLILETSARPREDDPDPPTRSSASNQHHGWLIFVFRHTWLLTMWPYTLSPCSLLLSVCFLWVLFSFYFLFTQKRLYYILIFNTFHIHIISSPTDDHGAALLDTWVVKPGLNCPKKLRFIFILSWLCHHIRLTDRRHTSSVMRTYSWLRADHHYACTLCPCMRSGAPLSNNCFSINLCANYFHN